MIRFYILPIEVIDGNKRGPMYFKWLYNEAGIAAQWSMMDYGFVDSALLFSPDISQADHNMLVLNLDVFAFPDNIDTPVNDPNVAAFFESIYLPTDWLTPATSYRELMRQTAGMMQFNQRYGGISDGHSIFANADLSTRLRQMTAQEEEWFYLTAESFGIPRNLINRNAQLRLLVKRAGEIWETQAFYLGGTEF